MTNYHLSNWQKYMVAPCFCLATVSYFELGPTFQKSVSKLFVRKIAIDRNVMNVDILWTVSVKLIRMKSRASRISLFPAWNFIRGNSDVKNDFYLKNKQQLWWYWFINIIIGLLVYLYFENQDRVRYQYFYSIMISYTTLIFEIKIKE